MFVEWSSGDEIVEVISNAARRVRTIYDEYFLFVLRFLLWRLFLCVDDFWFITPHIIFITNIMCELGLALPAGN